MASEALALFLVPCPRSGWGMECHSILREGGATCSSCLALLTWFGAGPPTGHTSCHRWAVEDAVTLRRPAKVLDCFHSLALRAAHRRVGWGSSPTPEAEQLWAPGLRGGMPCITGWSDLATQPRPRDREEATQDDVNTGTHKFVAQRERESLLLETCLCSLLGLQKDR